MSSSLESPIARAAFRNPVSQRPVQNSGARKMSPSQADINKFKGCNEMHPGVLMELADVIAMPLSLMCKWSWGVKEMPEDWRKAKVIPPRRKAGRRT